MWKYICFIYIFIYLALIDNIIVEVFQYGVIFNQYPTSPACYQLLVVRLHVCISQFFWFRRIELHILFYLSLFEMNRLKIVILYSVNLPQCILLDFPSATSLASLPFLRSWHRPSGTFFFSQNIFQWHIFFFRATRYSS